MGGNGRRDISCLTAGSGELSTDSPNIIDITQETSLVNMKMLREKKEQTNGMSVDVHTKSFSFKVVLDRPEDGLCNQHCNYLRLKSVGPKLVPFFKTLAIYFVVFFPEDNPSLFAMFLKCLPILSLLLFVLMHGMSLGNE
ncbi:hypothetical protein OUZ56_003315 [Daphnia magna]|uniref:lysoplasmalogenase n=1 Tax=Daphnia magna TaxID=35525 RepID=A0ABR0A8P2_9CRUS|nr:hypothetical protein OUZ56_003315 [Daphnia magna]